MERGKTGIVWGLLFTALVLFPAHVNAQCSGGPLQIDSNTTWSGTITLGRDVVVNPGKTLTIISGTTIRVRTSDSSCSGIDPNKIELTIKGTLVAIGGTGANDTIRFKSDAASPAQGDWYGIVDSGQTRQRYNSLQHARYAVLDRGSAADTLEFSTVTNTAVACSTLNFNLAFRSNNVSGGRHGLVTDVPTSGNLVIDGNSFTNQTDAAVRIARAVSPGTVKITNNRITVADSAVRGIFLERSADTNLIANNVIQGYFTQGHIRIETPGIQLKTTLINDNRLITGAGTKRSGTGLYVDVSSIAPNIVFKARRNVISGFTVDGVFNGGEPIDLGNVAAGDPGLNTIVTDTTPLFAAVDNRYSEDTLHAEGNWFGMVNPPSSIFSSFVDFDSSVTAPLDSVDGKVRVYALTAIAWGPGTANVKGDLTVDSNLTWTLKPNLTLSFKPNADSKASGLDVNKGEVIVSNGGKLRVEGTSTNRVVFTSPASNDSAWLAVRILPGGRGFADNAKFERAYSAWQWGGGGAVDTVRSSIFDHDYLHGILCKDTNAVILSNTFTNILHVGPANDTVGYGIRVQSASPQVKTNRLTAVAFPISLTRSKSLVLGNSLTGPGINGIDIGANMNKLQYNPATVSQDTVVGRFTNALSFQGGNDFGAQANVTNCVLTNDIGSASTGILYNGDTVKVSFTKDTAFGAYGAVMNSPGFVLTTDNCIFSDTAIATKFVDNNATSVTLDARSNYWFFTDTSTIRGELDGPINIRPINTTCESGPGQKPVTPEASTQKPLVFALYANAPNPFNPARDCSSPCRSRGKLNW